MTTRYIHLAFPYFVSWYGFYERECGHLRKTYDVIVTGARCSGSSLAIYLARAGYRVLLLDRSSFPSDTLSTNTFFNNTVTLLRELGVMDELLKTHVTPVQQIKFQLEDTVIEGPMPLVNGEDTGYCIRRTYLDHLLFQQAEKEQNVTALEKFRLTDMIWEDEKVVGVRGVSAKTGVHEFYAPLVVGADGRNSTIRQLVKSEKVLSSPSTIGIYFGYFSGIHPEREPAFEVYKNKDRMAMLFPTNHQMYVVVVNFPLENKELHENFKRNPQKSIRQQVINHFPNTSLAERLKDAKLEESPKGLVGYENYWYRGMGDGWALVGDAICFKDPAMAQGIHDAIYGAKILANVISKHTLQQPDWNQMAEEYKKSIQSEFMSRYYMGCELSKNQPITVQENAINQLISSNPILKEKFLGIYNYANEPEDFQNELLKIIGSNS